MNYVDKFHKKSDTVKLDNNDEKQYQWNFQIDHLVFVDFRALSIRRLDFPVVFQWFYLFLCDFQSKY